MSDDELQKIYNQGFDAVGNLVKQLEEEIAKFAKFSNRLTADEYLNVEWVSIAYIIADEHLDFGLFCQRLVTDFDDRMNPFLENIWQAIHRNYEAIKKYHITEDFYREAVNTLESTIEPVTSWDIFQHILTHQNYEVISARRVDWLNIQAQVKRLKSLEVLYEENPFMKFNTEVLLAYSQPGKGNTNR